MTRIIILATLLTVFFGYAFTLAEAQISKEDKEMQEARVKW